MTERVFTNLELHRCAKRELSMRKRAYARWVAEGRNGWDERRAEVEIAMMEAIMLHFFHLHEAEQDERAPKLL